MSSTICLIPIIAALFAAETSFIKKDVWEYVKDRQQTFISTYLPYKNAVSEMFTLEELKTCISSNVNDVNNFLSENNFEITLQEQPAHDSPMYLASFMNILVNWHTKGQATTLKCNRIKYPAVSMNDEKNKFTCFSASKTHPEPIIALTTQSKDVVYITSADKKRSGFDLLSHIITIPTDLTSDEGNRAYYSDIQFPMIDIDDLVDVSWLVNMRNNGWLIAETLQQTKFQMNENGAAAQSACAASMCPESGSISETLIIDKPFFLWIKREGLNLPIFAAYFDTDAWKKPKKLG